MEINDNFDEVKEVKDEAVRIILSDEEVESSPLLEKNREQVARLVKKLLDAAGIKDSNEELNKADKEALPQDLKMALQDLEHDFRRGILKLEDGKEHLYKLRAFRKQDGGTSWEEVKECLLANDCGLLKKVAEMPGGGELIGRFNDGALLFKTRGNQPVTYAFDKEDNRIMITGKDSDRRGMIEKIEKEGGRFANYWEIREEVFRDGYEIPGKETGNFGWITAAEVATGKPFVGSGGRKQARLAILDKGNLSSDDKAEYISKSDREEFNFPNMVEISPEVRDPAHGAISFLKLSV